MHPLAYLVAPAEKGFFQLTADEPGDNFAKVEIYTRDMKLPSAALIYRWVATTKNTISGGVGGGIKTYAPAPQTVTQAMIDQLIITAGAFLASQGIKAQLKVVLVGNIFIGRAQNVVGATPAPEPAQEPLAIRNT